MSQLDDGSMKLNIIYYPRAGTYFRVPVVLKETVDIWHCSSPRSHAAAAAVQNYDELLQNTCPFSGDVTAKEQKIGPKKLYYSSTN